MFATISKFRVVAIALAVALLGGGIFIYTQQGQAPTDPERVAAEEVASLTAAVGALIALPQDETPTIATVTDPEQLKEQPFFSQAKVGDKVLLYATARKAYLYDPVANKLLDVAPLNIGSQDPQTDAAVSPEESEE